MSNTSVLVLENLSIYNYETFDDKTDAIEFFTSMVKRYQRYADDENVSKDIRNGLLKFTFYDNSNKIMSVLIFGLSKQENEILSKHLEY